MTDDAFEWTRVIRFNRPREVTAEEVTEKELTAKVENKPLTVVEKYTYNTPYVPSRYSHILGEWNNGFVICDELGNEFVWVPVGSLPANGTLDGIAFDKQYGRRNYRKDNFSHSQYHEIVDNALEKQIESVEKYGGFYISRYAISRTKNEKPASVKGKYPWINIDFNNAFEKAQEFDGEMESHLVYGAEYDSVLEWLIATGKTQHEIAEDSTNLGNYWNSDNSPRKVVKTGSREEWYLNNIADLAGNVWEWTQEQYSDSSRVLRGGYYYGTGNLYPVAYRYYIPTYYYYHYIGFRVALYMS